MNAELTPYLLKEWLNEEGILGRVNFAIDNFSDACVSDAGGRGGCSVCVSIIGPDELWFKLGSATPYSLSGSVSDIRESFASLINSAMLGAHETAWIQGGDVRVARLIFANGRRIAWSKGLFAKLGASKVEFRYPRYTIPGP